MNHRKLRVRNMVAPGFGVPTCLMKDIFNIINSGNQSPFFKDFRGGPYVQEFEKAFAKYVGTKYAVSMPNGTLALNAAYSALNIGHKRFALTTPYTFVATVSELVRADLTPIFVDVLVGNASIDRVHILQELDYQKQWHLTVPQLVVAVHPLGSPCDMKGIMAAADAYNIPVIEDAAQSLSPTYRLSGLAACFSLQATKSLSTGEGGMVVTNSEEFYDKLCYLRNCGMKYGPFKERFRTLMGANLRLTEIQAAIGLHALETYDKVVKRQLKLGKILKEAMEKTDWIVPQDPWTQNGYIFAGRIKPHWTRLDEPNPVHKVRSRFLEKVKRWNRGLPGQSISGGYSELVYELPAFRTYARRCPIAEMWRDHAIWIDCRQMLEEQVKDLAREIERFKP